MELPPKFIQHLIELAEVRTVADALDDDDDDRCIEDFAGGNVDDAFESGCTSGMAQIAREVLDRLNIPYTIEDDDDDDDE